MKEYLVFVFAIILVAVLKLYSNYKKYEKARNLYVHPKLLASDMLKEKNEEIQFFLEAVTDVNELNILIGKCFDEIKEECK